MLAALIATRTPPLQILSTSPLPNGTLGAFYSFLLLGSGGTLPYTWAVIAGSLPPGLSLNSATGEIFGVVATPPGVFTFTIQLTDANGFSVTRVFTISTLAAVYGNQFVAATTTFTCIFLAKQAASLTTSPAIAQTLTFGTSGQNSIIGSLQQLHRQLVDQYSSDANGYTLDGALNNPSYLSDRIISVIVIALQLNSLIQSLPIDLVNAANVAKLSVLQYQMGVALRVLQSLAIPITLRFT